MNNINVKKIPIIELPSGEVLNLKVFDIQGTESGPKCYLQASVHGAEQQGNAVIYKLLEFLKTHPIKGSIRLVPMANPIALNHKTGSYTHGRFNLNTGDNWNRLYSDFTKNNDEIMKFAKAHLNSNHLYIAKEYKELLEGLLKSVQEKYSEYGTNQNGHLNKVLQLLAINSDYVLDLHTAPKGTRYLYAPEYLADRALDLKFPHNLIIPNEFGGAMDEASFMPWVNLKSAFNELGNEFHIPFESYTLELGSEECISLDDADRDLSHILAFLHLRGMVAKQKSAPEVSEIKNCKLSDYKTYYAPRGALYDYIAAPGQVVKKGELLAVALNFENHFNGEEISLELRAIKDCVVINHYPSSSVPSGAELYQVMEEVY